MASIIISGQMELQKNTALFFKKSNKSTARLVTFKKIDERTGLVTQFFYNNQQVVTCRAWNQ